MTKDNVLFSIIGVLLGFIVGFFFANSVNQKGFTASVPSNVGMQPSNLPADHPPVPSNGVADQGGGMQTAVQEAIQKARNEPSNFDAQMNAAALFYQINRYDEALEFLTRANQLRPDDYSGIVKLGDVNFDAGHYDRAQNWYTAALLKNPKDVDVRTDLGLTYMFGTPPDYDRAIKEFRGSLERDPKHEQSLQNLVVALTKKGDASGAQAALNKLKEVDAQSPAIAKLTSDLEKLQSSSGMPTR